MIIMVRWDTRAGVEAQGQEHHRNSSSGNVGTWHGPAPVGQGIAPRHVRAHSGLHCHYTSSLSLYCC